VSVPEKARSRADMLKQLRSEHAEAVARAQSLLKEQKRIQDAITRVLREKPATVPEVAAAVGIPSPQALWYLAAMRKYNLVVENGMSGDYPLYQLAEAD
jgi:DNA-directed RNA polymerase specialized sigma subunit